VPTTDRNTSHQPEMNGVCERFFRTMQAGVEELLRDKTRPSRIPPLSSSESSL